MEESLSLTAVLKLTGIAETGGHAKVMIQNGEVKLNGIVETRRKHKCVEGDLVEVAGEEFMLELEHS